MLVVNERRSRLAPEAVPLILDALREIPVRLAQGLNDDLAFALARRHNLTFYDASYLALAITEAAPLATLDKALFAAAKREGLHVIG